MRCASANTHTHIRAPPPPPYTHIIIPDGQTGRRLPAQAKQSSKAKVIVESTSISSQTNKLYGLLRPAPLNITFYELSCRQVYSAGLILPARLSAPTITSSKRSPRPGCARDPRLPFARITYTFQTASTHAIPCQEQSARNNDQLQPT